MAPSKCKSVASRFRRYIEGMVSVIGHALGTNHLKISAPGCSVSGVFTPPFAMCAERGCSWSLNRVGGSACVYA